MKMFGKDRVHTSLPPVFLLALSGSFSLFVSIGLGRFGYPPLISSLVTMKWLNTIQADYLGATNLAGYIIGAVSAIKLLNSRIGAYRVIMGSLAVAILSFFCCALHPTYNWFLWWRFLSGAAGGIIMIASAPTILTLVPNEYKGFVSGVIFAGVGLGIVFSGTAIPLLVGRGLYTAWMSYAIISTVLFIFIGMYFPKIRLQTTGKSIENYRPLAIDKKLIVLMAAYSLNAIALIPHSLFWVDFIDRGLRLGLTTGNHYWILFGLAAMAGPIAIGLSIDKIGFKKSVIISSVLRFPGLLIPVFCSTKPALFISTVGIGLLSIGYASLVTTRVQAIYGDIKKIWAWMTIAYALSHALAAYLFSYLFSKFGSYQLIFLSGAFIMMIGCLLDYWGAVSIKIDKNDPHLT